MVRAEFLRASVLFRRENFGGLAYKPATEDLYVLNDSAFSLLHTIETGSRTNPRIQQEQESIQALMSRGLVEEETDTAPARPRHFRGRLDLPTEDILAAPTHIELYPNLHCNERCRFCYVGFEVEQPPCPPMPREAIDCLVKNVDASGAFNVTILGGEPFLYEPINGLLEQLAESGCDVAISSNGTVERRDVLETVAKYEIKMNFALHADRDELHDDIVRHRGAFQKCLRVIEKAASLDIPFNITCVLTATLVPRIRGFVDLVKGIGGRGVTLAFPQRNRYALKNNMSLSFSTYAGALRIAVRHGLEKGVRVTGNSHYDFVLPEYSGLFDYDSPYARYLYGDRGGQRCLEMMPNGELYANSEFFGDQKWCVGNAFREGIRSLWRTSPVLKRIRSRRLPGECRRCGFRNVCRGGQYSRVLRHTNRLDAPPDDCPILNDDLPVGGGK